MIKRHFVDKIGCGNWMTLLTAIPIAFQRQRRELSPAQGAALGFAHERTKSPKWGELSVFGATIRAL